MDAYPHFDFTEDGRQMEKKGKDVERMEQFQVKQRTLVIRMPRELDHHTAEQIRRKADRMIASENISWVEFDFRDTDFMDSSGVGVIMGRYQTVRLLGGGVAATHVNDRIWRVLQLSGLTRLIDVRREKMWNRENE